MCSAREILDEWLHSLGGACDNRDGLNAVGIRLPDEGFSIMQTMVQGLSQTAVTLVRSWNLPLTCSCAKDINTMSFIAAAEAVVPYMDVLRQDDAELQYRLILAAAAVYRNCMPGVKEFVLEVLLKFPPCPAHEKFLSA